MKFVSLFTGIGGLDLGLERAGHECILQVEKDDYRRQVLERQWPNVPKVADVRDVFSLMGADMVVGGFPCQPVADQGSRRVHKDERWLWPEFHRLIDSDRPNYVLIENVPGLLKRGGSQVLSDLAESGYDAEWTTLTAKAFGAPHQRERLFIVAYPSGLRRDCGSVFDAADEFPADLNFWGDSTKGLKKWEDWKRWLSSTLDAGDWGEAKPKILGVDDGLPWRVDRERIKALGDAVVPQVGEYVGRLLTLPTHPDTV